MIGGQPIAATAPDASTVVLTYPSPSGPGLRLLDMLPILPKHKLESALSAGRFAKAWDSSTAAGGDRRHGPVPPARVSARSASRLRSQSRAIGGRRRTVMRFPISIASFCRSCPIRTRSCCDCSRALPTLRTSELRSDDYVACAARRGRRQADDGRARRGARRRCVLVLSEAGDEKNETRASPSSASVSSGRPSRTRSIAKRSRRPCFLAKPFRSGGRSRRATGSGSRRMCRGIRTTWRAHVSCSRASASRTATATAWSKTRRNRGALHGDHAARHRLLRARHDGSSRTGRRCRDRARHRSARVSLR